MIQRKQTLFLLISLILTIVCLCSPVAELRYDGMNADILVYNLWAIADGKHNYSVMGMFIILLITLPINLKAIFSFNTRKFQSRLCMYNMVLSLLWYAAFVVSIFVITKEHYDFHIKLQATFPLISAILYYMAHKAIDADERLVRAADRIR